MSNFEFEGLDLGQLSYQEPPTDVVAGAPDFVVMGTSDPTGPDEASPWADREAVDVPTTATPVHLSLPMVISVDFDPLDLSQKQNKVKGGPWPKPYKVH